MMMEEEADWDLQAVVRGFTSTKTTNSSTSITSVRAVELISLPQPLPLEEIDGPLAANGGGRSTRRIGERLEDICKSFCPSLKSFDSPISSSGVFLPGFMEQQQLNRQQQPRQQISLQQHRNQLHQQPHHQLQQRQLNQSHIMFGAAATSSISATATSVNAAAPQSQKGKKRKNMMKKVCQVPAEGLSSDMWAWRKYGQKPIKGSPYPRGYYRCSTSKGCLARKQVERNRCDPSMFIITYTAEHNHPMPTQRSTPPGGSRQKASTDHSQAGTASDTATANVGSPASTSTNTTTTPPPNELFSSSSPTISIPPGIDMPKDDDDDNEDDYNFFMGLQDLDGFGFPTDSSPDQFPPSVDFPWLAKLKR